MRGPLITGASRSAWWRLRGFLLLCALLACVPLLGSTLPPLSDLAEHIGRYRILADAGHGPLGRHYAIHWAPIGNLGEDLLVLALARFMDVEPAAYLGTLVIPPLTILGMGALARVVHGRMPATAIFAFPLAYSVSFQLGFVNFCLAQALMLLALAGWLGLADRCPALWRAALFAVIAPVIWLCHMFGWVMLGLFAFAAEWVRRTGRGEPWLRAGLTSAAMVAPMGSPLLLMLLAPGSGLHGGASDWGLGMKFRWLLILFREKWAWWDLCAVLVTGGLLWFAFRSKRMSFAPVLAAPAALALAATIALPARIGGGANVDLRMLAPAAMLAILSLRIRPGEQALERRLALAAMVFFLARLAGTTLAFAALEQGQAAGLKALDALPPGGGVLVLSDVTREERHYGPRLAHLGGIAIARRRVFTNSQWTRPGQQVIATRHPEAAPYDQDPSPLVYPQLGARGKTDFDVAIASFNRCTFQAVWTIDIPPGRAVARDLALAWTDGRSAVYRVIAPQCLSDRPAVR